MICVLSDTHENVPAITEAVKQIKALNPTLVIHCGDIISPPTLPLYEGLPMRFIFGNNDGEKAGLRKQAKELGFGEIDDTLELEIAGKKLFAYHGTDPSRLAKYINSQKYDYLFYGHTHSQDDHMEGATRVINPGALSFAKIYSFAKLEISEGYPEFIEIEAP